MDPDAYVRQNNELTRELAAARLGMVWFAVGVLVWAGLLALLFVIAVKSPRLGFPLAALWLVGGAWLGWRHVRDHDPIARYRDAKWELVAFRNDTVSSWERP